MYKPSCSQVHLPSRQSTTGSGFILPGRCKGDLLGRVAQHFLPTSRRSVGRWAKGLIGGGGGHFPIEQVAVAVSHHMCGCGVSVGHGGHGEGLLAAGLLGTAAAAAAVAGHERGKFWLLRVSGWFGWPSLGRCAHRHPAGVWVAVLVTFPGALAGHGYVRQRPGVWKKQDKR